MADGRLCCFLLGISPIPRANQFAVRSATSYNNSAIVPAIIALGRRIGHSGPVAGAEAGDARAAA